MDCVFFAPEKKHCFLYVLATLAPHFGVIKQQVFKNRTQKMTQKKKNSFRSLSAAGPGFGIQKKNSKMRFLHKLWPREVGSLFDKNRWAGQTSGAVFGFLQFSFLKQKLPLKKKQRNAFST